MIRTTRLHKALQAERQRLDSGSPREILKGREVLKFAQQALLAVLQAP